MNLFRSPLLAVLSLGRPAGGPFSLMTAKGKP
jgi:hypothetical protein